ncbi:YjjG family noncanonical pyrimidine nucleotidase [Flavobacterium sp. H122]|uniref:YjjG family noncanonical pyrimidine nucleotidase n=1 Tax=Flavobacterium sp. H122 TaxID=2529860 RepID=UPI0010A9ECBF|nr:YjjG family noncanonical pyrimidine nucleotidase [Flavobacterium sp. H122]
MYSNIKHIFFDLDHTLWDFDRNSEKAFEFILLKHFPSISVKDFVKIYAPINQACWKLYQNNQITHDELRYKRLKDTFSKLTIEISDELIDVISEEYIEHLPNSNHLFEGCVETLEYLHKKYKLHIITNGFAEVQFKKLNNSGIHHFFDTVTNSEMAGVKKPHSGIFEHALKTANALKNESIMIGDCLDADIGGAIKFGIEAVFFNPESIEVSQSIKQITNLVELKKIF